MTNVDFKPHEHGPPTDTTPQELQTQLNHVKELLVESEKLAAVGRLTSSIAHEINNPLESVMNLLYLARHSEQRKQRNEYLDTAERELHRIAAISSQTLRFHKQSKTPSAITASDLIATVLAVHHGRVLKTRVRIEKGRISPTPVFCFEGEIRQVLSNLIGNAIDAVTPESSEPAHEVNGRILVRAHDTTDWLTERRGLQITVADNGCGISPQTMKRIFDPFFTTKGMTGTGLGLWVSREIVARHHGVLRVRSRQNNGDSGTIFTLFLPFEAVNR